MATKHMKNTQILIRLGNANQNNIQSLFYSRQNSNHQEKSIDKQNSENINEDVCVCVCVWLII